MHRYYLTVHAAAKCGCKIPGKLKAAVEDGRGTDKAAGGPEPRRLGTAGAAWRAGMPGPMCSICDRGMPAMAAARVGFAAADAVGVPSLSLPRPGRSAVRGLALAGGILGVCVDSFLTLLLDSMLFHRNTSSATEHRTVSKEGLRASRDLLSTCLQGLE